MPDEALADTIAWLEKPQSWDENKGDPAVSDKHLADIQFPAALLACRAKLVSSAIVRILDAAARRLLPHQSEDGSFDVEPQTPVGSPVTYGTTLATYVAWKTLSASKHPEVRAADKKPMAGSPHWIPEEHAGSGGALLHWRSIAAEPITGNLHKLTQGKASRGRRMGALQELAA